MTDIPRLWICGKARNRIVAGALLAAAMAVCGAELPPEIAADVLLVRAERQTQDGDHRAALATLNEILALVDERGLAVPDAVWFRQAQAASAAGEHATAVASATHYLTTAGRDGEYYRAALELLEKSEREVQALREREAERLAAESYAEAAYRNLRENAAASPAGIGEVFAEVLQSGARGPAMVAVPAGTFRMGCLEAPCLAEEMPVHEVSIPAAFAVSVFEVTWAEWNACVAAGPCVSKELWFEPPPPGGARPVVYVSWDEAKEYAVWLSAQTGAAYRLLSESEWEYAARAGAATKYHWGNEVGVNRANCNGCGSRWDDRRTAPVGSFTRNGFGLHDMHGNVREWVADCWNFGYAGAPADGSAWLRGDCRSRGFRGGSWNTVPSRVRAAYRRTWRADAVASSIGFRVARTLAP